jgi:hypothetical protein
MDTSKTVSLKPSGQNVLQKLTLKDMDIIMKACGFSERSYTPDKDSEVDNVRVEATRPTTMGTMGDAPANTGSGVEAVSVLWVGIFSSLLGFAMVV